MQNLEVRAFLQQYQIGMLTITKQQQQQHEEDPYLRQLVSRIQGHLDSMQGNNHQVAKVDNALLRTRSKLDEVLYDGLDKQQ